MITRVFAYFFLLCNLAFITRGARYQFVGDHDEQQVSEIITIYFFIYNISLLLIALYTNASQLLTLFSFSFCLLLADTVEITV